MKDNGRHVPFLVNVKGRDAWLAGRKADEERSFTLCSLSWLLRRLLAQGS